MLEIAGNVKSCRDVVDWALSGIGQTPVRKKFAVLNWKSLIADEPKAVSFWLTVIHW